MSITTTPPAIAAIFCDTFSWFKDTKVIAPISEDVPMVSLCRSTGSTWQSTSRKRPPVTAVMTPKRIAASTQSEFAQYLHAEVQSQLMACKLLLLKAAESEFTLMSPEVTQKVLTRLELLKQPYERRPDRIPVARLQEFQNTWQGLANIQFNLSNELSQVSRNGEIISQLIEELIVYAIRHGKAKNITVSASVSDGRCVISVLDDGKLKSTKKSGLGSTLFEVFAPDWKLVATPQGTLATLTAKYY